MSMISMEILQITQKMHVKNYILRIQEANIYNEIVYLVKTFLRVLYQVHLIHTKMNDK